MARSMVLVFLLLAGGLAASITRAEEPVERRLTVTGRGEIRAVPDMASLAIGVETEAKTPGEALARNAARMTKVIQRLEQAGIAGRDMQTSQLSIWPVYAERQQPPRTVAYRATNRLDVTLRDIDRLGEVLDRVVADGANQVTGPTFSVAEPTPLLQAARDAAVADAIAKAEGLAAAAGVGLGRIIALDEQAGGPVLGRQARVEAMTASTPIAPGETLFSAGVTMVFEID